MIVDKVINNNLIRSHNKDQIEVLVMGCGLGFKRKPGDHVDDSKIEKVYLIEDQTTSRQLTELLSSVPNDQIKVANAIVSRAKERLGVKLNDKIYISITDHLNFAIERHDQGIHFKNALLWEIKHYYKAEYEAGLEALVIIEDQLGLQLPKDEAGYFAMHFAASSMESGEMTETTDVLGLIQSLIQIVKYHFAREFDESTIHYERFLTHLKFFAQRVVLGKTLEDENPLLVETMKREYANEFSCSVKIHEFVKRKFNRSLSETELMYLTIHIRRISYQ